MGEIAREGTAQAYYTRNYYETQVKYSITGPDIILRNNKCVILLHRTELHLMTKTQARKIFKFGWTNPDNNAAMTMLIGEIQTQLAMIDAMMQKRDAPLKRMRKRLTDICDAYTAVYNKMKKTKGE